MVLDDLMDTAYSTKVRTLFTNGAHHRNISLVLITQNVFHQDLSSCDVPLNSMYILVFKIPRNKTQVVHLARQVHRENIYSFHETYLEACKDPHNYLFLDLSQSIKDLLRFRKKVFHERNLKVLHV